MPLQNRVDPFGDIHAVDARGMFTGNRGIIHDPATKTLLKRRWTTKAWIICTCEYKGVRREVMGRNGSNGGAGWTELFFLDEVTALAAGHRPCFLCRREKAKEFAASFARSFGVAKPTVQMMDARLHNERLAASRHRRPLAPAPSSSGLSRGSATIEIDLETRQPRQILGTSPRMTETVPNGALPDGTVVSDGRTAYALRHGKLLRWSFEGYSRNALEIDEQRLQVVTSPTTIAVLKQGYRPVWHSSADD